MVRIRYIATPKASINISVLDIGGVIFVKVAFLLKSYGVTVLMRNLVLYINSRYRIILDVVGLLAVTFRDAVIHLNIDL